ncbi:hypothetical protein RB2945 [Rhodopirellula baltica SH 1]|uniref:Uncharacterized protein n=1 Tax=Rhodopirellula baltica (strain DSM 10527 / NCIMB 13988 / SH1) TaxID=243090 RepID=Q7UV12_RHOBA|nr:hypothetical protein RB2945 [Rhodopirellula baltica SH 1]
MASQTVTGEQGVLRTSCGETGKSCRRRLLAEGGNAKILSIKRQVGS